MFRSPVVHFGHLSLCEIAWLRRLSSCASLPVIQNRKIMQKTHIVTIAH